MPFDPFDPENLLLHFEKHGAEFGATTPEEYEQMAELFLSGVIAKTTRQCFRQKPMPRILCRYNGATEEYGAKRESSWILTYFKPDPAEHGFETNLKYYRHKCK